MLTGLRYPMQGQQSPAEASSHTTSVTSIGASATLDACFQGCNQVIAAVFTPEYG